MKQLLANTTKICAVVVLAISILAIVLVTCSLLLSVYVVFGDRSRLKQTGEYYSLYFKERLSTLMQIPVAYGSVRII